MYPPIARHCQGEIRASLSESFDELFDVLLRCLDGVDASGLFMFFAFA
jgi:hypothetical protein